MRPNRKSTHSGGDGTEIRAGTVTPEVVLGSRTSVSWGVGGVLHDVGRRTRHHGDPSPCTVHASGTSHGPRLSTVTEWTQLEVGGSCYLTDPTEGPRQTNRDLLVGSDHGGTSFLSPLL